MYRNYYFYIFHVKYVFPFLIYFPRFSWLTQNSPTFSRIGDTSLIFPRFPKLVGALLIKVNFCYWVTFGCIQWLSRLTFCIIISIPSYFAIELCDIKRDCMSVEANFCNPVDVKCVQPRRSSNLSLQAFLSNLKLWIERFLKKEPLIRSQLIQKY